jgi:hypothetical protein
MAVTKTKKKNTVTAKVTRKHDIKPDSTPTKTYLYKVEEGVLIQGVRNSTTNLQFPFELMKPGDSFLLPPNDPATKSPNTLHYAAKAYARMKPGFIITSRMQLDKSRRVWRLK